MMEESIPSLIRRIGLASRQRADALVRDLDLSGSTGRLLVFIERGEESGLIQRDLAELSGVRPASITVALQGLEQRGLIERRPDPKDDRRKTVHMTAAGHELVARFREAMRDAEYDALSVLSSEEQATLKALLQKLAAPLPELPPR